MRLGEKAAAGRRVRPETGIHADMSSRRSTNAGVECDDVDGVELVDERALAEREREDDDDQDGDE
jgi:hypothetical protein